MDRAETNAGARCEKENDEQISSEIVMLRINTHREKMKNNNSLTRIIIANYETAEFIKV